MGCSQLLSLVIMALALPRGGSGRVEGQRLVWSVATPVSGSPLLVSAQMAGLLCEEEVLEVDNVKYCGYCKYHFSKMVSLIRQGVNGSVSHGLEGWALGQAAGKAEMEGTRPCP